MLGTQMQTAQLNMGSKEAHMANNMVKTNLVASSSSNATNALTMASVLHSNCLDLRVTLRQQII